MTCRWGRDPHLQVIQFVLIVAPNGVIQVVIMTNYPDSFVGVVEHDKMSLTICSKNGLLTS